MPKDEKPQTEPCVIKKCENRSQWKGLCGKCYHQARTLITDKKVKDWDELAEMGLCIVEPKPFIAAFEAALAEREKGK